jgi:hypothetical protein
MTAIDLLEDSIALLRQTPASAWLWYAAGAVPFFSVFLWFVHAMTGNLSAPDPAAGSLVLAVLFFLRQTTRARFGQLLYERVTGAREERRSSWFGLVCLSGFAGLLRVLLVWAPFPYLSALFRNFLSLIWIEPRPRAAFSRAGALVGRGGRQLLGLFILALISLFVWQNALSALVAGPFLYALFTGDDSALSRNPMAMFSWPVILTSLILAWCLCDVVLAGFFALRRFYGESETSGADLLRNWRASKWAKPATAAVLIALCLASGVRAAEPPPLDHAIDEVLTQPQYQWRQAPRPGTAVQNPILRAVRSMVGAVQRWVRNVFTPVRRWWRAFLRWLRTRGPETPDRNGVSPPINTLRLISLLAILLVAGGLIAILLRSWRADRVPAGPDASAPVAVNLEDPALVASQLPESEWLALAGQCAERGDSRGAVRAWFLATLAYLGRRELVSISRFKSNLDYRSELARRARGIAGLDALFAGRVLRFETIWYGLYPVEEGDVAEFAASLERMHSLCG